jgi:hypothetical protein
MTVDVSRGAEMQWGSRPHLSSERSSRIPAFARRHPEGTKSPKDLAGSVIHVGLEGYDNDDCEC